MVEDFYDKVAKKFGNYTTPAESVDEFPNGNPEEVFKQKLIELGGKDKIVLDAGCGDGRFTLSIADHFKEVVGNDTSNLMLAAALKLQKEKGNKNAAFIEKSTRELNYPSDYFDVIYARRAVTDYPLFYRMLKPGGYVLDISIGERDAKEIKEVFERGQNFGEWNSSKLEKEKIEVEEAGFKVVYGEDFYYNEYYLTEHDLDIFLQGVPIFEDYDPEKDKKYLDEYTKKYQHEKGINLPRHRYVVIAIKE